MRSSSDRLLSAPSLLPRRWPPKHGAWVLGRRERRLSSAASRWSLSARSFGELGGIAATQNFRRTIPFSSFLSTTLRIQRSLTLTFWDPQLCETRASQPRLHCCSALQTSLPRRSAENYSSLSIRYGQEGLSAPRSPSSQPADRHCQCHRLSTLLAIPSSPDSWTLRRGVQPVWHMWPTPMGDTAVRGKLVENQSPPFGMSFGIHHQHAKGIANDAYVFFFYPRNPENEHMGPFVPTSFVCCRRL